MTDTTQRPVKCRLCNSKATRGQLSGGGEVSYYTSCDGPDGKHCPAEELFNVQFTSQDAADAFWNLLMSDTSAKLEGARLMKNHCLGLAATDEIIHGRIYDTEPADIIEAKP